MKKVSSWPVKPLGELVSFKTGKLNSNAATKDGPYPFFTCSQETLRTNTFSFNTECVLLAGNNASGVYPIKYFSGKFDAYQRTYVIEPLDSDALRTKFIFYALQLRLSLLRSISTGAATKFLTLGLLREIEIPLPSISLQDRISTILSAYDDLFHANLRRIEILEEACRVLFQEFFKQGKSKTNPSGSFGDICSPIKERYDTANHSHLPLLDLAHLPSRTLAPGGTGNADELTTSRTVFAPGDTLFGTIRCYLHKVVFAPFPGVTNTSVMVLRAKSPELRCFLSIIASSPETIRWATKHSSGTKMPVINWDVLRGMPIPSPTLAVVGDFEERAGPMLDKIGVLSVQNIILVRTRNLLLQRLLTGQAIDEDAVGSL